MVGGSNMAVTGGKNSLLCVPGVCGDPKFVTAIMKTGT
jgi:hypothetical protein